MLSLCNGFYHLNAEIWRCTQLLIIISFGRVMLFMSSQITFLFELMHFLYMCQGKVTYLKVYMMYYKNILSSEIYHILLQINHIVFSRTKVLQNNSSLSVFIYFLAFYAHKIQGSHKQEENTWRLTKSLQLWLETFFCCSKSFSKYGLGFSQLPKYFSVYIISREYQHFLVVCRHHTFAIS